MYMGKIERDIEKVELSEGRDICPYAIDLAWKVIYEKFSFDKIDKGYIVLSVPSQTIKIAHSACIILNRNITVDISTEYEPDEWSLEYNYYTFSSDKDIYKTFLVHSYGA
jgi:hypothetical protein